MSAEDTLNLEEHAWVLANLERVDRLLLRRDDREQVLDELLGLLLEIFACHRAWIVAPERDGDAMRVCYQRAVPEDSAAGIARARVPFEEGSRAYLAALIARRGRAMASGEGNEAPLPHRATAGEHRFTSQLAMALEPAGDAVWTVGLHHCAVPRTWTAAERWLFEGVGRRVSDALERLRVAEEVRKLSTVVTELVDPLLITDLEGRIRFTNRAVTALTGHAAGELAGRSVYEIIAAPDRALVWRDGTPLQSGGVLPPNGEYLARHADGTIEPYGVTFTLLRDEGGAPREIVASARNVSAEKRAAQERAHLAEQLRQSQKMEAVGRLAGGVAHDFNNLVTAILGHAEIGLADLPLADPLRENLQEIVAAAERAATLTSQLLAFSRRQIASPRPLNLNRVIDGATRMLERLIGEEIAFVFEPRPDLWPVRCDVNQIEQVLVNLVVNARDAMPEGGTLTIRTDNVLRTDAGALDRGTAEVPTERVLLCVHDTGAGIAPETRERIFEPFFSTKPQGAGTGLGLAMVYGIVRQNEGVIEVISEPGAGASFEIYLPRAEAAAVEALPAVAPPRPPGGSETVLVVEDETSVRQLAVRMLSRLGYDVLEAAGGPAALEMAAERRIDLLLTDVIMPQMNGRELYERLQASLPGLRVVYMSGYAEDVVATRGVLAPEIAFVAKPFSALTLGRKVREALDRER